MFDACDRARNVLRPYLVPFKVVRTGRSTRRILMRDSQNTDGVRGLALLHRSDDY
jgi:hypothetical protein